MEAVATPFLPAVAEAIALARDGAVGPVRHVEASFGYPVDRAAESGLFAADAGVLLDRAVYPLTLARIVLGPVTGRQTERTGQTVRMHLTHAAGGQSDVAMSFDERLANRLMIDGDSARILVSAPLLTAQRISIGYPVPDRFVQLRQHPVVRRAGDIVARCRGQWRPFGASPYLPELQHFCGLVREQAMESPVLSHQVMLDVQRIIADAGASS
jgi:predicted dehydrogenase